MKDYLLKKKKIYAFILILIIIGVYAIACG